MSGIDSDLVTSYHASRWQEMRANAHILLTLAGGVTDPCRDRGGVGSSRLTQPPSCLLALV